MVSLFKAEHSLLKGRDDVTHEDDGVRGLGRFAEEGVDEQCRRDRRSANLDHPSWLFFPSLKVFSFSADVTVCPVSSEPKEPRRAPTRAPAAPRRIARRTRFAMDRPRSRSTGG